MYGSVSPAPNRHRVYLLSLCDQDIEEANEDIQLNTTAAYRSPEQIDLFLGHVVSEKVDIWALGVLLYRLTGVRTPFEDDRGNVDGEAVLKGLGDRKVGNSGAASSFVFPRWLL